MLKIQIKIEQRRSHDDNDDFSQVLDCLECLGIFENVWKRKFREGRWSFRVKSK
jgi:hypothetical protein